MKQLRPKLKSMASVVMLRSRLHKFTERAVHHIMPESFVENIFLEKAMGAKTFEDWNNVYGQMKKEIKQSVSESTVSIESLQNVEWGKFSYLFCLQIYKS